MMSLTTPKKKKLQLQPLSVDGIDTDEFTPVRVQGRLLRPSGSLEDVNMRFTVLTVKA